MLVILRMPASVRTRLLSLLIGVFRWPVAPADFAGVAATSFWAPGLDQAPPGRRVWVMNVRLVSTAASLERICSQIASGYLIFVKKVDLSLGWVYINVDTLWINLKT